MCVCEYRKPFFSINNTYIQSCTGRKKNSVTCCVHPTQNYNLDLFINIFVQNLFHKPTQTYFRQHVAVDIFVRKLGHSGEESLP